MVVEYSTLVDDRKRKDRVLTLNHVGIFSTSFIQGNGITVKLKVIVIYFFGQRELAIA